MGNWLTPWASDAKKDGTKPEPPGGALSWLRKIVGWPGAPAALGTPAEGQLVRERVRSGPEGVALPWFLPFFDDQQTVGETQEMRNAYRYMLKDPNVASAFKGKILAACGQSLKVIPRDRKDRAQAADAELVRWNLEEALDGGLPGLIWSVCSGGCIDGYSVCEKVWAREPRGEHEGAYHLRALKPKDAGKDVILVTDDHRNVVSVRGMRYNAGVDYHPSKFLIYRHLPLFDVPTGMSDFRCVYGTYWMLDTVKKLRAMALEKRALPVIVGHYTSAQDRPAVEEALALVKSQNWLAVPETVRVEAMGIAGAADATFDAAIKQLSEDVFLGVAGATLQARQGDVNNGRGSSAEHRNTADLFIRALVVGVESLLNDRQRGLVKDIIDLNRVADVYPRAQLSNVDDKDLQSRLAIFTGLWEMGVQLSREAIYDEFNIEPPDPNDHFDSLGGKADQEAQTAAATMAAPGGPAGAAAADRVLTDETAAGANEGGEELTSPFGEPAPPARDMAERVGGWRKDGRGIDAGRSTGAGVDTVGRHYAVVRGRRVPLPPFASAGHEADWLSHVERDFAERDSGRPFRGPSGRWFRHDRKAGRVVPAARPEEMGEEVGVFTARPRRMAEPGERNYAKSQTSNLANAYQREYDAGQTRQPQPSEEPELQALPGEWRREPVDVGRHITPESRELLRDAAYGPHEDPTPHHAAADWLEEIGHEDAPALREDPERMAVFARGHALGPIEAPYVEEDDEDAYGRGEELAAFNAKDDEGFDYGHTVRLVRGFYRPDEGGPELPVYRWEVRRDDDNSRLNRGDWSYDPRRVRREAEEYADTYHDEPGGTPIDSETYTDE